jgi:3-isopropylmalate/(R)-2-methylmalate dehydratase small subunit
MLKTREPREIRGRARRLGDDINTDYIVTSTRKRDTLDETVLARYLLETLDPEFAASVQPGDILVAGRNFGCGSAMEIAVTVILAAGIRAVVAQSFARTFYRNAINNGLIPIECDTGSIAEGDTVTIRFGEGRVEVEGARDGVVIVGRPMPPFMHDILDAGGLVGYLRLS